MGLPKDSAGVEVDGQGVRGRPVSARRTEMFEAEGEVQVFVL